MSDGADTALLDPTTYCARCSMGGYAHAPSTRGHRDGGCSFPPRPLTLREAGRSALYAAQDELGGPGDVTGQAELVDLLLNRLETLHNVRTAPAAPGRTVAGWPVPEGWVVARLD